MRIFEVLKSIYNKCLPTVAGASLLVIIGLLIYGFAYHFRYLWQIFMQKNDEHFGLFCLAFFGYMAFITLFIYPIADFYEWGNK